MNQHFSFENSTHNLVNLSYQAKAKSTLRKLNLTEEHREVK